MWGWRYLFTYHWYKNICIQYTYNIERYIIYIYKQHVYILKDPSKINYLAQLTIHKSHPIPTKKPTSGSDLRFSGKAQWVPPPIFLLMVPTRTPANSRSTHQLRELGSWNPHYSQGCIRWLALGFLKQTNVWTSLIPLPFSNPVRYGRMVWVLRGRWRNPMEIWASSDRRSCRS